MVGLERVGETVEGELSQLEATDAVAIVQHLADFLFDDEDGDKRPDNILWLA